MRDQKSEPAKAACPVPDHDSSEGLHKTKAENLFTASLLKVPSRLYKGLLSSQHIAAYSSLDFPKPLPVQHTGPFALYTPNRNYDAT